MRVNAQKEDTMVYSNKFVMCVLVNGRPQKELANGQVSLPFGTEYSLRFRNKNDRRAVVEIWIDGENVSGSGYVVNAHDYVDIKRHHDIDRSFKFVSLDSEDAIEHGKNGPNHDKVKGVIEAKFRLEVERPNVIYRDVHHDHHHHHHHDHYKPIPMPRPYPYHPPIWLTSSNDNSGQPTYGSKPDGRVYPTGARGMSAGGGGTTSSCGPISSSLSAPDEGGMDMECSADPALTTDGIAKGATMNFAGDDIAQFKRISIPTARKVGSEQELQDGCTVEGHSTGQQFRQVHIDLEYAETSLKLFLVGYDEDEVEEVVVKKVHPKKKRRTVKDDKVTELEDENQRLRQELADLKSAENLEAENERIKDEIEKEKKKKVAKKRVTKKRTKKKV
jgi:hypothetical protein